MVISSGHAMGAWVAMLTALGLVARGEIREGMTAFVPVKKHEAGASAARSTQADSKANLIMAPAIPRGERNKNKSMSR